MEHLFSEIIDQGVGPGIYRMRENAFDSSTRQGEMSYSAFHYFHFVGVCFLFLSSCRQAHDWHSRLTVLQIRYCPMALPAI